MYKHPNGIKKMYYILKQGYYYRFNSAGYTAKKEEAQEYTYIEMKSHLKHCSELTSEIVNN